MILTIEVETHRGESYDNSSRVNNSNNVSLELDIRVKVQNFVSKMHDEGYYEFNPSYYRDIDIGELIESGELRFNGNLKLTLDEDDDC